MRFCFSSSLIALAVLWACGGAKAEPTEGMLVLSTELSPRVAYQVDRVKDGLHLVVEADAFGSDELSIEVGAQADKLVRLGRKDGKVERTGQTSRWSFEVPGSSLVADAEGWKKLRLGLAVEWLGGPAGQARQRERFLHLGQGALHAGLAGDPAEWQPVDLEQLARDRADRALEIGVVFPQPLDGKGSVVIEDGSGRRVRNLVAGQALTKGDHRFVWDGLDEHGNVVPPGDYRWRGISHPGLTPVHLMDFCDAEGSNHSTFQAAVANGGSVFFAAPVTEGGYEIVELGADGAFRRGFNPPHGHGLGRVALATDGKTLFIAHDGLAWGVHVDRSKAGWKEERTISVMRLNLETWQVDEFPGKVRHAPFRKYEAGPGKMDSALAGFAWSSGKLYLADALAGELMVIDPATAKEERVWPLPKPAALSGDGKALHAVADGNLVTINPVDGKTSTLTKLKGTPGGLASGPDGRFYVSDIDSKVVRVLASDGREERVIGSPGGISPGKYDLQKLENPCGLAVLDGKLWVCERDRWQPKRLAAFDLADGRVAKEYFGPTNYGAQGGGFDPRDATRWIGQGAMWKLDFKGGTATPVSILGGRSGRRFQFHRQDGRTFLITSGKATWIQELRDDGTLKPLACLSSAHQFAFENEWRPPAAFVEAFKRDYPAVRYTGSANDLIESGKPDHGYGMLWVDRNGDGAMQEDEIEFATTARSLAGAGWSHDFVDLTMKVAGEVGEKKILVTLKPDGWWPGGAPRYPALNDAVAKASEIDLPGSSMVESATDRFGNVFFNSDPEMRSVSPDGTLRWTYPNRWSNVHGSHKAPLPHTGELQGSLFFSGVVPLDEKSDVFLINGNHGRAFVMTSDGLYLDEMFPDVRMMTNPQAGGIGILGGECFGGTFGRADDGEYYFQAGGISYRIYRIKGLREVRRSEGLVKVSAAQAAAAARKQTQLAAVTTEAPETVVPFGGPVSSDPVAKWDRDGKFDVSVKASQDGKLLRLQYEVADASPWVNRGSDWQTLFKTGDGVDFQLATDPEANPRRGSPVPGDLRLFVAPMGDSNVAVLYRHRVPGAPVSEAVNFQSPWRSEKVDSVRRLERAQIMVKREGNRYRVEVSVPLEDLGISTLSGRELRGDFGVIYGDAAGTQNVFRNYWSNQVTGLVNDVPGEIMLTPNLWGKITFAPSASDK